MTRRFYARFRLMAVTRGLNENKEYFLPTECPARCRDVRIAIRLGLRIRLPWALVFLWSVL